MIYSKHCDYEVSCAPHYGQCYENNPYVLTHGADNYASMFISSQKSNDPLPLIE